MPATSATGSEGDPGADEADDVVEVVECSAKGCRQPATWELRWNNPKLHTPERRKSWVACEEHRGSLADFLTARRFLRDVVPLG